ncbi:hypothetical protein KC19_2G254900 [Ceratodon purpureus]|uniref:Uncharacterized protein n=1 Tax=Ceratodon purpureus TaxID=3225 RepID=A0A8T0J0Q2_CERPU|nr:hypothetical protein KC19_2G254900 [Ceratodon purpureus]
MRGALHRRDREFTHRSGGSADRKAPESERGGASRCHWCKWRRRMPEEAFLLIGLVRVVGWRRCVAYLFPSSGALVGDEVGVEVVLLLCMYRRGSGPHRWKRGLREW